MGSVGRADGSAGVENMGNRSGSTVAPRMFGVPRDEGVESNASPVAGGELNTASGKLASVSGGRVDTASGGRTWASGGQANIASGALLIDARKSHTLHRQPHLSLDTQIVVGASANAVPTLVKNATGSA